MTYKSKAALEQFIEVIRNADKTFLDPEKTMDEQAQTPQQLISPIQLPAPTGFKPFVIPNQDQPEAQQDNN